MAGNLLRGKVVVITGGAAGIGRCMSETFAGEGAAVIAADKNIPDCGGENGKIVFYKADVGKKEDLEGLAQYVAQNYNKVNVLIHNAPPVMRGIGDCTYEEFSCALAVGVTAPFYLSQLFLPYFDEGSSIINISSSRDRMSQPRTESYTSAKGGIAALTHAMAVSLAGKVRVNSISPGWIDTAGGVYSGQDQRQQPAGRIGRPEDIAHMAVFLASGKAGFITGENICIDGGMTRQMIYHGDFGWTFGENK